MVSLSNVFKRQKLTIVGLLLFCLGFCTSFKTYKCDTCRNFTKSFKKGIEQTARSNFGGGNTNWEEKNLGKYLGSETRFLEILENSCEDADKSECHSMIEVHEEYLEIWWFEHFNKKSDKDLFMFFCHDILKVCCPNGTFGPDCLECPGGKTSPCSGHGSCEGNGSRKGKGTCSCQVGYEGETCDECSENFFEEAGKDGKITCSACHKACKTSCTGASASDCDDCKSGWKFASDQGCVDVDECQEGDVRCAHDEFCSNEEGTYTCKKCNRACDGCVGPNQDQCLSCSARHFRRDSECVACHPSCDSYCIDESASTCDACGAGWQTDEETGACTDVNECEGGSHNCDSSSSQYCVNDEGSFHCSACPKDCRGCSSRDRCLACREGYRLTEDGSCTDIDECSVDGACPGENEKCANTVGSYRCDCIDGYVRRMGSACFKKNTVSPKGKKSKHKKDAGKEEPAKRTTVADADIAPGPDGFRREDIERLGDPIEPEEEMMEIKVDEERDEL